MSDASGIANFTITGATINTNGVVTGSGLNGATIYACEIALGQATVACFDENGAVTLKGLGGTDLTAWLADFGKQGIIGYKGRSDFDHNGAVAGVDLSYLAPALRLGQLCGELRHALPVGFRRTLRNHRICRPRSRGRKAVVHRPSGCSQEATVTSSSP